MPDMKEQEENYRKVAFSVRERPRDLYSEKHNRKDFDHSLVKRAKHGAAGRQ